jgi:hypothetical protein
MKLVNKLLAATLFASTTVIMADGLEFEAVLTGEEEVPNPVTTDTTGFAEFEVDEDYTYIEFELEIEDGVRILAGPGGHIHCAPAGQNGPLVAFLAAGLPVGFNGDVEVEATIDEGNILNDACGGTIEELVDSFIEGRAYVNIHSADYPAGEIRGQIYQVIDDDDEDEEED